LESTARAAHCIPTAAEKRWRKPLRRFPRFRVLDKLLELLAIADEASSGLGLPASKSLKGLDEYEQWVMGNLILSVQLDKKRTTLCQYVDPALMAVFPKCHTPRSGTTLRSLSHHLALIPTGEVETHWFWAEAGREGFDGSNLNVLVLPWPLEISPRSFKHSTPRQGPLLSMPTDFGFFEYEPSQADGWMDKIESLIKIANDRIGDVDLIVLPELALNEDQLKSLAERLSKQECPPMIVAGTLLKQAGHHFCRNVCATLTFNKEMKKGYAENFQDKHHRWRLDPKQVKQYGLGAQLSPSRHWWEGMEICSRTLKVFALKPWLTLCTLICEDLARPEPIADTVRAIGPSLVVALLMDGPQLRTRWPARYGSVLSDDPGSSVLTVTSLGMSMLSTPGGWEPSRVVALWRDAATADAREISLPKDCEGLVLCLTWEETKEFTADGRDCGGTTSHVTLSGRRENT
jgi:hypothetical protein